MRININADIGESFGKYTFGADEAIMPLIGSANIACGMHAGDPTVMTRTVALAIENGVSIGAHPGFNDIWGFGRRQIRMAALDLEYLVTYQIGALLAIAAAQGARVTHVKPHGALNNMAHDSEAYATAVANGIKAADRDLIFVANANSEMTRAGEKAGLRVANESYIDRRYDDHGKMISRDEGNAVINDAQEAADQVLRFINDGAIYSVSGKKIPADIHTFCLHSDEPTALALMQKVSASLAASGIDIVPLPDLLS